MISYPGTFACPTWQYAQNTSAFPVRTPFECGWTRQRRSEQDLYQRIGLSFVMNTTEYAIWSDWATNNGSDWFLIRLDDFNGSRPEQEIRFIAPISYNYDDFDNVYVTVPAEVSNEKANVQGPPYPPSMPEV